jgi:hypothetical protein
LFAGPLQIMWAQLQLMWSWKRVYLQIIWSQNAPCLRAKANLIVGRYKYLTVSDRPENNKHIQLLSSTEVEELYARPELNANEQRLYFTLTQLERATLAQSSNTKTRIYFILQLGYFKAKQQFFNFSLEDGSHDARFIVNTPQVTSPGVDWEGSSWVLEGAS